MVINNKKQVKIYVNSLVLTLKKNSLFLKSFLELGNELFLINAFICSSTKTKTFFLENNSIDKLKYKIILDLFPGISSLTKIFLNILLKRKHLYLLSDINYSFQEKLEKIQKVSKIKIIICSSLPTEIVTLDNLYTLLLNTLKSSFNSSNFIIDIYYDPKILGGIIFEHENFFLDLSIKSSLKKLVKIY